MKALIIVDLQYDFLPGGKLAVPHGDEIIKRINELQAKFELIIATQDWHPEKHQSFASQHPNNQVLDIVDLQGYPQTLWPDHCVQGTKGAELSHELHQNKLSAIIRKGMNPSIDSYSAFFDNNHQRKTGLHGYLQEHGVTEIFVCGLAADFCVYFTAMDALKLGYKVHILERAVKAIDNEMYQEKLKTFITKGGQLTSYLD
ncbi:MULTISPECIES: bifunctional nicotinamidase/pyrazinamidase [Weeksella]|uniref:bifunctional nicotinamidase/pyrazinamidase n=1 Tax=Weeksella TaxID=1013 RepID=UPI0008A5D8F9|nr:MULTISPECIES: bifunctional nicotinamidase/pyrazinamidase [Weeksella]MDK7374427.1 bifunctional nicotinamidase/pyrazinamidase [Weeksella virosa]OFM81816.1 nicotinamidase [Weeksella sp. HMSC059D05]